MSGGRVVASGRLARLGFTDAERAQRECDALGIDSEQIVETLAVAAADPDLALRQLGRIVSAATGRAGDLGVELLATLRADAVLTRRLALVLGASAALGDHLVHHVEDWRELADPALTVVRPTAAALTEQLTQACDRDDLRRTYRRLLLRLAARDLDLGLRLDDAAAELADLASGAVAAALRIAAAEMGTAVAERCRLSVIAMGKCGGRELNYVSDVDVVFVAEPADGVAEADGLRAAAALAATMIRVCSDHTREGTLWPVDAALRPEGKAGPLVRTLSSHQSYYERWAKTWEFQALLKARPIAGDAELGRRYTETIGPLVWTAASRPDFVADVRSMRRRVFENLPAQHADRELKLGPGGLRDIEFAVQLLQMVHGRADENLRSANTLVALGALTAGGYVGREDGAALTEAYRFLRTLEHRLQLSRLRRTHVVPTDPAALRTLGRSMGMSGEPGTALTTQWRHHAREARRLHERLFYRPLLEAVASVSGSEARLTTQAARQRLEALGYVDPPAALRHLEALTAGVSRRAAIQRALLPAMLGWFATGPDPDGGLLGFRKLSDAVGSSHWYLGMLRDEGVAAERLAHLLASSRYATDLLMRAPEATALLVQDAELAPRDGDALTAEARTAALRRDDPTEAVTAIRAIRRRELFRCAAADALGLLDVETVGTSLSAIARATLAGGFSAAVAAVEAERGAPLPTRIALVAVGRLGGGEMSYASDADVLFVHEPIDEESEQAATQAASAVANELRRLLALPGPDPALHVDVDLRPEGRQGPLVRTLSSYAAYYARWSKVWEAQALLRAAPVTGDAGVGERFVALIDPLRYPSGGLSPDDVAEVRRVKARVDSERLPRGADPATHLKLGRGGIADVEWTVQLLQLCHAHAVPALRTTRTLAALEASAGADLLDGDSAQALAHAWRLASKIRNATMLARARASDTLPKQGQDSVAVASLCGYDVHEAGRLADDYRRASRRARNAVDNVFWR